MKPWEYVKIAEDWLARGQRAMEEGDTVVSSPVIDRMFSDAYDLLSELRAHIEDAYTEDDSE